MTELSGFTPVTPLAVVPPQSLRVPTNKTDAIAQAATILEALWDAVDNGLAPNIKVEVLRHNPPGGTPTTMCRITPTALDGVANTVANPGDWLCADTTGVKGMTNDAYAAQFTQNVPIEWAATTTPPQAVAGAGLTATLTFPQPTSANRPFTYTADGPGTIGEFVTAPDGTVTAQVTGLADGAECSWTITVNTQYPGVTATSVASNTITAFDQPSS